MSWPRSRSESGCSETRPSSSPTRSASLPRARSASMRSWSDGEVQLVEPADLGLRPPLVREVREGWAAPERERLAQAGGHDRRLLVPARRPRGPRRGAGRDRPARRRARSPPGGSRSPRCRGPCGAGRRTSAGSSAPWPAGDRPRDPRSAGRAKQAPPRAEAGSRGARAASLRPARRRGRRRRPRAARVCGSPLRLGAERTTPSPPATRRVAAPALHPRSTSPGAVAPIVVAAQVEPSHTAEGSR